MHFQLDKLINESVRSAIENEIRIYLILQSCYNYSTNETTNDNEQIMDLWLCSVVTGLLTAVCSVSVVGFAGNAFVIDKFRKQSHSSFSKHVQCLAVTDMVNLLVMVADSSVHYVEACSTVVCRSTAIQIAHWHVFIWYLGNVLATTRHYQTLYFAIDRYAAVRRPLHFLLESKCEKKHVVQHVALICALSSLVNVPQTFKLQTLICEDTQTIMSISTRLPYLRLYTTVVSLFVQLLVPLVGSVAVSVMLVVAFRRQLQDVRSAFELDVQLASSRDAHNRRGTTRSTCSALREHTVLGVRRTRRLNRSLLIFVFIFAVCELPVLIYFYVAFTLLNTPVRQLVVSLAFMLSAIDSSMNFVAYFATRRNLRPSQLSASASNRAHSTRHNSIDARRSSRIGSVSR